MVVVDSSVWVDVFRGRTETPHVAEFIRLVEEDAGIALTDIVLTEILQGLSEERDLRRVERRLADFDLLRLETPHDFGVAARLHRNARHAGLTIRRTLDCLIAAVCIREETELLHNDRDFDRLAETSELRLHPVPTG